MKKQWLKEALAFGMLLFIINFFLLYKSIIKENIFYSIIILLFLSALGGIAYGYTMKIIREKFYNKD